MSSQYVYISSEKTDSEASEYGWAFSIPTGMTDHFSSECEEKSYAQTSDFASSEYKARSYSQMTDFASSECEVRSYSQMTDFAASECKARNYSQMTDFASSSSSASSSVKTLSSLLAHESRVDRIGVLQPWAVVERGRVEARTAVPPSSSPFPADGRLVAGGLIRQRSGQTDRKARRHNPFRRTYEDQRSRATTASRQASESSRSSEKTMYFKDMTTEEIVKMMMIAKSILKS